MAGLTHIYIFVDESTSYWSSNVCHSTVGTGTSNLRLPTSLADAVWFKDIRSLTASGRSLTALSVYRKKSFAADACAIIY
jgi:hypothetical protein